MPFYQVGQEERGRTLLSATHPQAGFWRQANANFLDICVLEWCKLLGDKKGNHHWSRVVSDLAEFEAALLRHVGMNADAFEVEIKGMRSYRDKFIAHLDNLPVMHIPMLKTKKAAVWFYHGHVVTSEAKSGELAGIPADTTEKLNRGYDQCIEQAKAVFASISTETNKRTS